MEHDYSYFEPIHTDEGTIFRKRNVYKEFSIFVDKFAPPQAYIRALEKLEWIAHSKFNPPN